MSKRILTPKGFNGPFVGKIPVVLAEPVIQVDVESVIQLEKPVHRIKCGGHIRTYIIGSFPKSPFKYILTKAEESLS